MKSLMTPKTFLFVTGLMAGTAAFFLADADRAVEAFIFGGNFALLLQVRRFERINQEA